ncbi:Lrp/AsnC family transcriptional regulator [Roseospira navarrensis]|uniref:AsnC family transcriptional regulator n=1 Tax=Roseospira navarrensis TaxID=140058 RepID=A0A7X2D1R6_9PROT|nr:Lrp/AsnC family transcriptional regulator [Roseospira navarrensis]MQX35439.1 AsnC family transcriptional regulator [Roseospira navarrensis]
MPKLLRLSDLDATDHRILEQLQADGRVSNQDLAERVHLSPSACHRRVARLEAAGAIAGYAALVDPEAVGRGTTVFVHVTLERQTEEVMAAFETAVAACPDIIECHLMSGEADYLVKVAAADLPDFERIHRRDLTRLPGVARLQSSFTLRTVKKSIGLTPTRAP